MSRRYIPLDSGVNSLTETAGVVTLTAAVLLVEDVRDYNWILQLEVDGGTAQVETHGPRGTPTLHSGPLLPDNAVVIISAAPGEFYNEIIVTFVGSSGSAAVHWRGEERGR